jgi:hypothetical protein
MLGIFNGTGSGKIIRLYRAFMLNNQTAAVTGLNVRMKVDRFTTGSGGVELLVVKHDTQSPSLPSQIVCSTNMSFTTDVTLKRFLWSSDEPLAGDNANIDEFQTLSKFGKVVNFDWSYYNSTIQPYVLRQGYGVGLVCENSFNVSTIAAAVGSADIFFEFTVETS